MPQEQRLFRRLSVFVGGCTLQAAATVCNHERDESEERLDVLEGSASLVDKSFVLQTEREGDEPRLLMLETIREYGLECLEASGETATTRRAHARYYLGLAQEAQAHLEGTEQAGWLERLERECQPACRAAVGAGATGKGLVLFQQNPSVLTAYSQAPHDRLAREKRCSRDEATLFFSTRNGRAVLLSNDKNIHMCRCNYSGSFAARLLSACGASQAFFCCCGPGCLAHSNKQRRAP